MSLGKQAASGAVWNYASFLVSKGTLVVATLVLANLLSASEFGLVSTALLVIMVLDILRDFGIGAALIQRQGDLRASANVTFWISAILGVGLFAINWLVAPVAAGFFKTESPGDTALVIDLMRVLGFSLLFLSLGSTHDALLQKNIDFRRRMIPEVARTVVKGVLQVGLALSGFGVWSLVIGQVVGEAVATVLLWVVERWRPTFTLDRTLLRPMLKYSYHVMMVNGLGSFLMDVDYLIIGRFLGVEPLGIYTIAYRIPDLLIRNLSTVVSNVAFPVTSRLQTDVAALRSAYLKMQHYMLLILAPMGFGLYAVTAPLMHLLFGNKWVDAIPVMEILTIYTVIGGIGHWPGVIYKSVGRPDILNKLSFVKLVVLVPVLWWAAVNYGIIGVAWGQLVIRILGVILDMAVVSRFVNVSVLHNLRVIAPPFIASIIMAIIVRLLLLLDTSGTNLLALLVAVPVGAAIYAALVWLLDRETTSGLLELGRGMMSRGSSSKPTPDARASG